MTSAATARELCAIAREISLHGEPRPRPGGLPQGPASKWPLRDVRAIACPRCADAPGGYDACCIDCAGTGVVSTIVDPRA